MTTRAAPPVSAASDGPDGVRSYLTRIGRVPLLDAAQEVDLARRIEAGVLAAERLRAAAAELAVQLRTDLATLARDGDRARRHLVEANLRLVVSIAKRYLGLGVPFPDLVQEGNIGLMRAVEKFDHTKGYKFSTYATWWIRQALSRSVAEQSRVIRIPSHVVDRINLLRRCRREMLADLGREPTTAELAVELGMPPAKIDELSSHARETLSLDQRVGVDDGAALGDLVEDATAVVAADVADANDLRSAIVGLLTGLSAREAGVVRLRYGLTDGRPRTLDEIGKVYGVSRERVRQIEHRTMTKLRHPGRSGALREHLG